MPPVKLHYRQKPDGSPPILQAEPDPVEVKTGDTLTFALGEVPSNVAGFTVTIHSDKFVPPTVTSSEKGVEVVEAVAANYDCQLVDSNKNVVESRKGGGKIKPGGG
jgi:hypothetical protein